MDDINLEGEILIYAQVLTEGQTEEGVYVFNSVASNELTFTKIVAPTDMFVTDKTLHFSAVENAVGYELYKQQGTSFVKINTNLITTNGCEIEEWLGDFL